MCARVQSWCRRLTLLVLLAAGAVAGRGDEVTYGGEARDAQGALAYTERHTVRRHDGRLMDSLTEYRAPGGELVATLRSDYARSVALPTYVFEDLRRNYREGLRWQDGGYVIFHQTGSTPEKTARLRSETGVFSCQGWHYYLINNLALLERDALTLNLVLPSELRPYAFVVKRVGADESRVAAELSLRNWLLRPFAPKLHLEYDRQQRRLREYRGLSNLLTETGERQQVTIRYTYTEDSAPEGR